MNININFSRLNLVNTLFCDLIYNDFLNHLILKSHISQLVEQIKYNINFLINEYYFTNIIEFEYVKKKIIHHLIMIKNIFYTFEVNINFITKINHISNIIKSVIYPAHLNLTNSNKYKVEINEIKKLTKIKFYHKPESLDVKNNFYDEEIDLDEQSIINFSSNINNNNNNDVKQLQNNKNIVISNKLQGNDFYNKIDFNKSSISI